jgi:hypothetical protein
VDGVVSINFLGEHNHPVEEKRRLYKDTKTKITNFIRDTPSITPTEVLSKITQDLSFDQLNDLSNIPSRQQVSDIKHSLVHSNFPERDHLWNAVLQHGQFNGATRFIKFFSLIPFFIILSGEEESIKSQLGTFVMIDTTHSTTSPALFLTTILSVNNQECKYLFYLLILQILMINLAHPCCFVFHQLKSSFDYELIFNTIKKLFNLNVTNIMVDFDHALHQSLRSTFPEAQLRGCYFHFKQAIRRWCKNHGLLDLWDELIHQKVSDLATSETDPKPAINGLFTFIIFSYYD